MKNITLFILIIALGLSHGQLSNIGGSNDSTSDSLVVSSDSLSVSERPHVVEREYDHTEQVIAGSIFMVTIIFLLSSMNNFNPKHDN